MHRISLLLLALLVPLSLCAADLPKWDFETEESGWLTIDKQATLTRDTAPAHVHQGLGSLRFIVTPHEPEAGELPGILLVPMQGLVGAAALHLALQTSASGACLLALRENDESTYMCMVYLQADEWHVLDIPLNEFRLDEKSPDENGMLDLGQVETLAVADTSYWLTQANKTGNSPFFFAPPDRRELWVDEVEFLPLAPNRLATPQLPGTVMLEDCDSDTAYFTVMGGRNLRVSTCPDPAIRGTSLRLDYELPQRTILAVVRPLASGALRNTKGLSFSLRSGAKCTLIVGVEEEDRSRYNKVIELEPMQWQTLIVPWSELKLSDDSHDEDTGLQPEKLRNFMFADVTPLITGQESGNTLWIDEITTAP